MVERRNFQRVPFAAEAEINCEEKKIHGELLDISLQGALIQGRGTIPFETGNICELSVYLSGPEITLQFDVNLVHREDNRLGFRFIGEDTETMAHLKRLLELNIGSSEILDKEISFWLRNK